LSTAVSTARRGRLPRELAAEVLGTAGLLAAVVGSGVMAQRLADGNIALAGVLIAHAMFSLPAVALSSTARTGAAQWLSEAGATFGLVGTILGTLRARPQAVAFTVGLYITAAYWFTASTSFANPAVTVARSLTNAFAGIAPAGVPGFVAAELAGALAAAAVFGWLLRDAPND
jgi:glycerol uptake facilitator-like aquaporin